MQEGPTPSKKAAAFTTGTVEERSELVGIPRILSRGTLFLSYMGTDVQLALEGSTVLEFDPSLSRQ